MNIKQSYINHSGKVFFAFIIVCFMTFVLFVNSLFTRTEDSYRVAAREVVALEQKYDKYWDTEGKKLALAKEDLFKQEQVVNSKLEEISKEIEEKKKLTKKELLNEWKPTYVAYYVDNKKKKYRIIEEGIGGAEDGSGSLMGAYTKPSDLFYTCLKEYKCYVTQSDREHFSRNGYLATDIGTADKNLPIRLPDFMGKEVVYTLKYVNYPKTTGATVEAFAEVDGVKIMWRIGHTHWDWDNIKYNELYHNRQLKTGTIIAYSGGEKEESFKNKGNQGATTGKHVHIEYLMWDGGKYAPAPYRLDQTINVHKEDNSFIPTAHAADLPEKENEEVTLNLDVLADAVAYAETGRDGVPCVLANAVKYNNCFGIRNGNTAPCPKVSKSNKCIYEKKEDSYEAFKTIWMRWYKTFPTYEQACIWTGGDVPNGDHADTWLKAVTGYYNEHNK